MSHPIEESGGRRSQLWIAHGPREVEARLLAELERALPRALADAARLARPVRVIVPSRSLRLHVAERAVRLRGAVAGLQIQTLRGVALEVLERAGEAPRAGDALLGLEVRRRAHAEPALRSALGHLFEGYDAVTAGVRDLLDAGFEEPLLEPLLECLAASERPAVAVARAVALVRVTDAALRGLRAAGLETRAGLLRRAAERIERDGRDALPCSAVFVTGFADATGAATGLLRALQSGLGATLLLNAPPPAGLAGSGDPDLRFGRRLREQLEGHATVSSQAGDATDAVAAPALAALIAPTPRSEWRAVAARIRALLDQGVRPERIGVVARRLEPVALIARQQLARSAVPFSGVGSVSLGGALQSRSAALDVLLERGARTPLDHWLEARADLGPAERVDLRLALRALGLSRLSEIAPAPLERDVLLPVRAPQQVEAEGDDRDAETAGLLVRRRLSRAGVEAQLARARRARAALERWPQRTSAAGHAEAQRALATLLGWSPGSAARDELEGGLARLEELCPSSLELAREEWVWLWRRESGAAGQEDIGGCGGGVALLSAMEARGRCFEHLFLVGLQRDVFPRPVSEDPLLSDALRRALRDVLPDLPVKGEGRDEERFLFAELLSSAPHVTVSWALADDDGRSLAPSVLIERLRESRPDLADRTAHVPALLAEVPAPDLGDSAPAYALPVAPRPAWEWALRAGARRDLDAWRALDARACEERARLADSLGAPGGPPLVLAGMRARVAAEWDRVASRARAGPLGPWFGLVGPAAGAGDPRTAPLHVTTLEALARCGWRTFVERVLRIEALPDPLQALPEVDARLVGTGVHRVLDAVARRALADDAPRDLAAALAGPGAPLVWPEDAELAALLRGCAEELLREEPGATPALTEVLAERMRPAVEVARDLDRGRDVRMLGSELDAAVPMPSEGPPHTALADGPAGTALRFRVDRVERTGDGRLVLVDYKTGAPLTSASKADTRRDHLQREVRSGEWLQAALYAASAEAAVGRYAFLRDGLDPRLREHDAEASDGELRACLEQSVAVLAEAWRAGAFVPRLVDDPRRPDEPSPVCRSCRVAEACLRLDSSAPGRLAAWLASEPSDAPSERAAAALARRRSERAGKAS